MAEENKYPLDYERRFGGVAKLYTKDGAERLKNAHVCVVGLGAVSYTHLTLPTNSLV